VTGGDALPPFLPYARACRTDLHIASQRVTRHGTYLGAETRDLSILCPTVRLSPPECQKKGTVLETGRERGRGRPECRSKIAIS
jgi:hypothetical protein